MKKSAMLTLACALLYGAAVPAGSQPIEYELYRNDPKGDLDGQNPWPVDALLAQEMENSLIRLIDGASKTVDCALYDLDRASIIAALKRAVAQRGVKVRVTVDGDQVLPATTDDLVNAGVSVTRESNQAQSHNKYIVVDKAHVWTGSTNITNSCFVDNANNAILIHSGPVAQRFTDDFENLFAGLFHNNANRQDIGVSWFDLDTGVQVAQIRNPANDLTPPGTPPENLFPWNNLEGLLGVATSPKNNHVDDLYVSEIDRADRNIFFCIYTFSHDPIRDAITRALGRGVEIYGVFDSQNRNVAGGEYAALKLQGGIGLRLDKYDGYLHDKFMVIDAGTGSDPTVLTGSYNWTALATTTNDENVVSIHDRAAGDFYYALFEQIYGDRSLPELGVNGPPLPARYAVEGRVMDEKSAPMADIEVRLGGAEAWSALTDAQGNYWFETLKGGAYTVTVPDQANSTFTTTLGGPQGANSRAYNPLAADKAGQDFYRFSGQVITRTPTSTPTRTATPTPTPTPTPTACILLDEDFEGAWPPAGWAGNGADQSKVHPRNSLTSVVFDANADTLVTPLLDHPGVLSYWMYASAGVTSFNVKYGATPQGPWSALKGSPTTTDYNATYKQETLDLSSLRDVYIQFSRNSAKTYYMDDVSISCNPITRTPTPTPPPTVTPTPTPTPTRALFTTDIILIVDRSDSMDLPCLDAPLPKIDAAKKGTSLFIDIVTQDSGNRLSLVRFGRMVEPFVPPVSLAEVTAGNVQSYLDAVNGITTGGIIGQRTCYGLALQEAFAQLMNAPGGRAKRQFVYLLTDGNENLAPLADTVYPEMARQRIQIHSTGFGVDVSPAVLEDMAKATGGTYAHVPEEDKRLQKRAIEVASEATRAEIPLDPSYVISATTSARASVPIDASTRKLTFILTWREKKALQARMSVVSPNGTVLTPGMAGVRDIQREGYAILYVDLSQCPGVQAEGTWAVTLSTGTGFSPRTALTAAPSSYSQSLVVDLVVLCDSEIKYQAAVIPFSTNPSYVRLLCRMTNRGQPVTRMAAVPSCALTMPPGTALSTTAVAAPPVYGLYDDGLHGDGAAGDGTFGASAYLPKPGCYSFHFIANGMVTGTSGNALYPRRERTVSYNRRAPTPAPTTGTTAPTPIPSTGANLETTTALSTTLSTAALRPTAATPTAGYAIVKPASGALEIVAPAAQ